METQAIALQAPPLPDTVTDGVHATRLIRINDREWIIAALDGAGADAESVMVQSPASDLNEAEVAPDKGARLHLRIVGVRAPSFAVPRELLLREPPAP